MKLANHLSRLGTETAFAVSEMAARHAAGGNRVFAFHLGDIALPPPTAMIDAVARAVRDGHDGYCPGAGLPALRAQLARVLGEERELTFTPEQVSVQPGGKPVIGKFLASVMNAGDEVLYPLPGFPIYESQIRYQGGVAVPYHYRAGGDGMKLDMESLRAAITPRTRALIYNDCHNPTGAAADADEMDAVAELAVRHNLWVLSDEAYANIRFDGAKLRSIAGARGMRERTVILFTCSKQFAMTGWRVGAAIGPPEVIAAISKFNTNAESCTTHFIQHALAETLQDAGDVSTLIAPTVSTLHARRDLMVDAMNAIDGITVTAPPSAFYIYADAAKILARKQLPNADALMRKSLTHTGMSFCTGEHFGEPPDTKFIRLAFSAADDATIRDGLAAWKRWVEE